MLLGEMELEVAAAEVPMVEPEAASCTQEAAAEPAQPKLFFLTCDDRVAGAPVPMVRP